jgi:hypothetical protein
MTTISSGKILAIAVVGILAMMIAMSVLGPQVIATLQQQSSLTPEEEQQRYLQLLNTTTTTTNQTAQIIQNIRNECESAGFIGIDCVSLVYESPRMIVIEASDRLTTATAAAGLTTSQFAANGNNNPFIWKVVDGFKELGYSLTSAELGTQGSEGNPNNNPHTWYVVMSK